MKRANNSHTTTTSSTLHTSLLATCFLTSTKEGEQAAETTKSLVKTEKKETSSMSNWVKL